MSSVLSATNALFLAANKQTTTQQLYAAAQEAVNKHNNDNAAPEPSEEEKIHEWDQVFATKFMQNDSLDHLSQVSADEKEVCLNI
jgi:hypothetical protein